MAEKTTYIILRKIPFQDSSLIVSGLSPEFGRLDFLLRGARGTGAKKFPYAELFRELAIEFRPPKLHSPGTMCNLTSHELIASFDSIAVVAADGGNGAGFSGCRGKADVPAGVRFRPGSDGNRRFPPGTDSGQSAGICGQSGVSRAGSHRGIPEEINPVDQ